MNFLPSPSKVYTFVSGSNNSVAATSRANITSLPGTYPDFLIASTIVTNASSFDDKFGAKPPSSPTAVFNPLPYKTLFKLWNISAPILNASLKFSAPTGIIINS